MKVLMLGWEFPPHITGGLGTACEGLLHGFANSCKDVQITFVLPALSGSEQTGPWRLIDASADRAGRRPAAAGARHQGTPNPSSYGVVAEQVAQYAEDVARSQYRFGHNFDVIHAHDWLTIPAAVGLKAATGKPLVVHVHSTVFDRNESPDEHVLGIEKAGLAAADQVIAVSHYTKELLVKRFLLQPAKIRVVHNGWIPSAWPASEYALRPPLVCFLGRLTYQKGPLVFLHAARRVLDRMPMARFVMAGDGDLRAGCESLARQLRIDQFVEFPGFLDRSAGAVLLGRSAAFVMPSMSEPFGIVALEAAAAGVPVILSRRSGAAEVLSAAVLVDPLDEQAIADAVCGILQERRQAADLAKRARLEATGMRWETAAEQIANLYAELKGPASCSQKAA